MVKNKCLPIPLTRNNVALSIKVAIIVLVTLAVYHRDLILVGSEAAKTESISHILIIPFLFAFLIYRKRKMLKATIPLENFKPIHEVGGVMLCLLSLFLYWQGSQTFHPLEYHMATLPLFAAGSILIIFNAQTLGVLVFPLAFLLFLTPPPLHSVYLAGASLSTLSSEVAYATLKAMGLPVSLTSQYGTPVIALEKAGGLPLTFAINMACAGIYSLVGFTIFAVFVTYIARVDAWKKLTIFLTGFPLIYALNVARIIIIVLIGYQHGMETAMEAFHLFGGWFLILIGTFILLTISEKIWKTKILSTKPERALCSNCALSFEKKRNFCPACGRLLKPMGIRISKRDLCKIAVLIACAILVIPIGVPVFALTEGPGEIINQLSGGEQASTQMLPKIPGYMLEFVYRDKEFEEMARQDASLVYVYIPTNNLGTTVWVAIEVANSRSVLHEWEFCLITTYYKHGRQPPVTQLDLRDAHLLQNPPLIGRFFAFKYNEYDLTEVILYWYESVFFKSGSSMEKKYVKISVIAYDNDVENIYEIEDQLLSFGRAIASYWQPIETWSKIAIAISQHATSLVLITIASLAVTSVFYVIKKRKDRKYNLLAYNRLALEEEKIIVRAVDQAAKKGKPTGDDVASVYQKLAQKPTQPGWLFEKLDQAEKAGLLEREIISCGDEPVLIWKSQVSF